jgi:hypothetical protein
MHVCVRARACYQHYENDTGNNSHNGNFTGALLLALQDQEISRKDIRSEFFGAVIENVVRNELRCQRPHSENNMTKGFAFRPC